MLFNTAVISLFSLVALVTAQHAAQAAKIVQGVRRLIPPLFVNVSDFLTGCIA